MTTVHQLVFDTPIDLYENLSIYSTFRVSTTIPTDDQQHSGFIINAYCDEVSYHNDILEFRDSSRRPWTNFWMPGKFVTAKKVVDPKTNDAIYSILCLDIKNMIQVYAYV